MVTGDHPATASAIAREVGIVRSGARLETVAQAKARRPPTRWNAAPDFRLRKHRYDEALVSGNRAPSVQERALQVVTGREIAEIKPDDVHFWAWIFSFDQLVFARTTPDQASLATTSMLRASITSRAETENRAGGQARWSRRGGHW